MNSYKQASSILSGAATKEAEDFLKKYPTNTSSSAPLKEESKLNMPFTRVKRLLRKEEALLSENYREQLADLLAHNEMVEKVYKMKQELQMVWKKRTASRDELLKAMQAWCKEAEESGIRALEEFAQSLRQYSTKLA